MNAEIEGKVQDKYSQLWHTHHQALIGKYFQKENLSGKGRKTCTNKPAWAFLKLLP